MGRLYTFFFEKFQPINMALLGPYPEEVAEACTPWTNNMDRKKYIFFFLICCFLSYEIAMDAGGGSLLVWATSSG
jgi:hypothetical protein